MKASKGLIAGMVVAVMAVAVVGVIAVKAMRGTEEPAYLTAEATMGDIELAVLATGTLQPAEVVAVGAQANGQVTNMYASLGDQVKRGEMLAVIESFQLQNQVRQAEQQLNQSRSQLNSSRANLQLARNDLERETLLMQKGVGTQTKLDNARNRVTNSEANVAQQESSLRNQELNLENARNNLDRSNIRAPIDGVIAEVVVREGQTINNNQQVPTIVKIAKMDVMTVRTQVSEADIIRVTPGLPAYFTILGDPSRRYHATLRTRELTPAGGVLDPSGGGLPKGAIYYNVLFEVRNEDGILFPGMTAEVHVVLDEVKNVLTIPSAALGARLPDGRYNVKVVQADGRAVNRPVRIGLNNNSRAEVRDGLKAGDKVVIGEAGAATAAPAPSGGLLGGLGS